MTYLIDHCREQNWPYWATEDGRVTLVNADCLDVLPLIEAGSVDCVVTSPPYNTLSIVGEPSGSWADSHGGAGFVRAWRENGYADDMPESEYQSRQLAVFGACAGACDSRASLFYNHKLRWRSGVCVHPVQWFRPEGWHLRQEIIWDRGGGMMSNAKMFCGFDERILWLDRGAHKWNQSSTGHGTVWRVARMQQQQGKLHPVQYPLELPTRCVEATTYAGDVVLDPYAGSATTGVAAIRLGRRFIGIEIEPRYFSIAVDRIKAELTRAPLFEERPKIVQSRLFSS